MKLPNISGINLVQGRFTVESRKGGACFNLEAIRGDALAVVIHDTRALETDIGPDHAIVDSKKGENYAVSPKYNFRSLERDVREFRELRKQLGKRGDSEAFHEGVLNLPQSADLKTGLAMAEKYAETVREKFGFRAIAGVAVHYDEGTREPDGSIRLNKHAHIIFDKREKEREGMTRIKPNDFRIMQDLAAKITGMPRGEDNKKTGARHVSHQNFRRIGGAIGNMASEFKILQESLNETIGLYLRASLEIRRMKEEISSLRNTIDESIFTESS